MKHSENAKEPTSRKQDDDEDDDDLDIIFPVVESTSSVDSKQVTVVKKRHFSNASS